MFETESEVKDVVNRLLIRLDWNEASEIKAVPEDTMVGEVYQHGAGTATPNVIEWYVTINYGDIGERYNLHVTTAEYTSEEQAEAELIRSLQEQKKQKTAP